MLSIAARFRSFHSKKELNQLTNELLKRFGRFLRKSCKALIKFFARHSVNVLGVSFPSIPYILEKSKLSRATYYRAIHTLQCIGFIKVHDVGGEKFFQIQRDLDWDLVEHILVGPVNETQNDTVNETVEKSEEPIQDTVSNAMESGLSLVSFPAYKIHEWIEKHFPTFGYDWLGIKRE